MKNKNQGITITALIITIIILLILAGVTITGLTGENAIIKNAENASNLTEIRSLEEQIELAIIKAEEKHRNTKLENVIEELKNIKIITNENQVDTITGKITTNNGYEIEGKLDDYVGITAKDIANEEDKSKYYGATVEGYTCQNSEAVPIWKIFYADNENIYLIAGASIDSVYAPNGRLGTEIQNSDNNTKSVSFRYINDDYEGSKWIEENSLAKKWLSEYLKIFKNSTSPNIKATAYLLDTKQWSKFVGEKALYAIGAPTVELICASYKETHPNKYIVYAVDPNKNGYETRWNDDSESEIYPKNYTGQNRNDYNNIYSSIGWMASPDSPSNTYLCCISPRILDRWLLAH